MADKLLTPEFRFSYPYLFKPRPNPKKPDAKGKYELMAMFPKGCDLSALKAAAKAVTVEKFGADPASWPKNLRLPFRDQGEKQKMDKATGKVIGLQDGCEEGAIFLNLRTEHRPGIVDAKVQPIIDDSEIYSGCYGKAQVHAFYYDVDGNKGIAFGLDNVQKTRDGDPLGGRVRAEDAFEAVAGAEAGADAAEDIFK